MQQRLRRWPQRVRHHFHDRHILVRLLIAGQTLGFGLVFLFQSDLFHSTTSRSYNGMAWMPQIAWGGLAVVTGLGLVAAATDLGRRLAYLLALFFWISVTTSLTVGAGTILTGTTTYGCVIGVIVYKLISARSINEPGGEHDI